METKLKQVGLGVVSTTLVNRLVPRETPQTFSRKTEEAAKGDCVFSQFHLTREVANIFYPEAMKRTQESV